METTSSSIKYEQSSGASPADSFVSTPGSSYPPLFDDTVNTIDVMTPKSFQDDDSQFGGSSGAGTPAPEKKPIKKRKSWGQQLPEPKTNLPPRKRAKTEDEKEQRRVERVLRNRRAAQSSRERKRQEVEALEAEKRAVERRNMDLELRLADMEAKYQMLQEQLERVSGSATGMTVFRGSPSISSTSAQSTRKSSPPITFSQELFSSCDEPHHPMITDAVVETRIPETVNPASLSPEIRPVADSSNARSSDMTQHPAAMLCDLQCQSEKPWPWMKNTSIGSTATTHVVMSYLIMTSTAFLTFLSPLSQIIKSLKTGSSLSVTPSLLPLIIWMATTTVPLTSSTSEITSMMTSLRPRLSFRISLLKRLLACSPNLARPLMDATMVALRSASKQLLQFQAGFNVADASQHEATFSSNDYPSIEALVTLLWAIHVIERERKREILKLDAVTEVEQVHDELDSMFGRRKVSYVSLFKHGTREGSAGFKLGQNSWAG